jgi:hypothetical protein
MSHLTIPLIFVLPPVVYWPQIEVAPLFGGMYLFESRRSYMMQSLRIQEVFLGGFAKNILADKTLG